MSSTECYSSSGLVSSLYRNDSSNKGSCSTKKKAKDLVLKNLGLSPFLAIYISLWNWASPFTSQNFNLLIFQMPDFQDYEN